MSGWQEHLDESQTPYYFNRQTMQYSTVKPLELEHEQQQQQQHQQHEWWPGPEDPSPPPRRTVQLRPRHVSAEASPGDHLQVDHVFHTCARIVHERCLQTAQAGPEADPFHDCRMADDRNPTRIEDMMACFQVMRTPE